MTVKQLYGLCDNLDHNTRFTIRAGYLEKAIEVDVPYIELVYYWDKPIKGFKVDDLRHCTIYM